VSTVRAVKDAYATGWHASTPREEGKYVSVFLCCLVLGKLKPSTDRSHVQESHQISKRFSFSELILNCNGFVGLLSES